MLVNIIVACIALIIIICLIRLVIGTVIGLIVMGINWIFYAMVAAGSWLVNFIFRQIGALLKSIYKKIRDRIRDKFYPDEGAYHIDFGPKNRKGTFKIKYKSIR